jgi:hypothetical protein
VVTYGEAQCLEQQLVSQHVNSQLLVTEGVHTGCASARGSADLQDTTNMVCAHQQEGLSLTTSKVSQQPAHISCADAEQRHTTVMTVHRTPAGFHESTPLYIYSTATGAATATATATAALLLLLLRWG